MASERDLEVILQQILQIQVDAGLDPETPYVETLEHLLRPVSPPDGPTPSQPPPQASQQTFVILISGQVDPSVAHVIREVILSLSQNRPGPVQLSPPGQSVASTMPEDANQVQSPAPSIASASSPTQVAQLNAPTDDSLQCPVCEQSFGRSQEKVRHVLTHLPYWLFCPLLGCPWRGDRPYTLRTHWTEKHADFGGAPDPEDCKIYNPDPLVRSIVNRELLIEGVTETALQAVRIRAQELDKVGVWEDEWGRGQRVQH